MPPLQLIPLNCAFRSPVRTIPRLPDSNISHSDRHVDARISESEHRPGALAQSVARRFHLVWDDGGGRAPSWPHSAEPPRGFAGRIESTKLTNQQQNGMQRLSDLPVTSELRHHAHCFSTRRSSSSDPNPSYHDCSARRPFPINSTDSRTRSSFYLLTTVDDQALLASVCTASIQCFA